MTLDQASKPWQAYAADELEHHYNPRATNPDSDRYGEARAAINAAGLAYAGRTADIAYGDGPLRNLDIYRPATDNGPLPVHIFIHGGYWRSREKEDFGFIGKALADQGLLGVVINYPLCPDVTLDEVVASNRAAFAWIHRNIANHGGDPARITLSGHSAGAHLGAAILATDWADLGTARPLQGAVLVSGIYDPHPTQHISVNAEIGITPEIAERQNYLAHAPRLDCPVHVIVGGGEPEGWIAQSADYTRHLVAAGVETEYTVSGTENHFSIQDQFHTPDADVLGAILKLA
ncbi:MAG: alpha/beta hydrolase [Hyphomicrobiaceae bacterium]